jgi:LPS O-antigen subunit length determinant protein (WzzB/FepE family)
MWSSIEDIIEIAAAVLVVLAAVWAVTAKVWRVPQVINRIEESNVLERLEAMLTKNELALKEGDKPPIRKRAG